MLKKLKKKMTEEERKAYAWKKMMLGGMIVLLVGLWTYLNDVRSALLIVGLLIFLKGFLMACRKK